MGLLTILEASQAMNLAGKISEETPETIGSATVFNCQNHATGFIV